MQSCIVKCVSLQQCGVFGRENCFVSRKKIRDDWFYWPAYTSVIRATLRAWSHAFVWPSLFFSIRDPALIWIWYDSKVPIMYICARPHTLPHPSLPLQLWKARDVRKSGQERDKVSRNNAKKVSKLVLGVNCSKNLVLFLYLLQNVSKVVMSVLAFLY